MKRNFKTMLKEGKTYEDLIAEYFKSNNYIIHNKSDDEEFQKKSIDFLIERFGKEISIEVKADTKINQTKNIVIEDGMHRATGFRKGWLHKCEADVLCYIDIVGNFAYLLNWKKIQKNIDKYGKKVTFDNKFDNCKGSIYLLNLREVEKYNLMYEKVSIKSID